MNHRRVEEVGNDVRPICGRPTGEDFALSAGACSSSFVSFNHDYSCTQRDVNLLKANKTCEFEDGRLLNSPCTGEVQYGEGACVFQPRVHVWDNWGWCTGVCPGGVDGSEGCFEGGRGQNECDIRICPGPNCVANPWINFGGGTGYVIVRPTED